MSNFVLTHEQYAIPCPHRRVEMLPRYIENALHCMLYCTGWGLIVDNNNDLARHGYWNGIAQKAFKFESGHHEFYFGNSTVPIEDMLDPLWRVLTIFSHCCWAKFKYPCIVVVQIFVSFFSLSVSIAMQCVSDNTVAIFNDTRVVCIVNTRGMRFVII